MMTATADDPERQGQEADRAQRKARSDAFFANLRMRDCQREATMRSLGGFVLGCLGIGAFFLMLFLAKLVAEDLHW